MQEISRFLHKKIKHKLKLKQMKKCIFLFIFIFCNNILSAQCPTGHHSLTSQAQIDDWPNQYPNCTDMQDGFTIQESTPGDITNLNGISDITTYGGNLRIYNNTALTNLSGLENVTSIGGQLRITDNTALTDISQLSNFSGSLGAYLKIQGNTSLTSLTGLEGLTSVGQYVIIYDNDALTDLSGLDNLSTIGEYLFLFSNGSLTSLTGLNSLNSIGTYLTFISNGSISSLSALSNLNNIGTHLRIINEDALVDFTGLENITLIGDYLEIKNNFNLQNLTGLNNLISIGGFIDIHNNYFLTDISALSNITSVGSYITIYDNVYLSSLTGLNGITNIPSDLYLDGNNTLTDLQGLNSLTTVGGYLQIGSWDNGNTSLTSLSGLDNLVTIGGNLAVYSNDALTNLSGLGSLSKIGANFWVWQHDNMSNLAGLNSLDSIGSNISFGDNLGLQNLNGLESLTTLGKALRITNNDALTDITALSSLDSIGSYILFQDNEILTSLEGIHNIDPNTIESQDANYEDLEIFDNPQLSNCSITSICDMLDISGKTTNIHDNAMDCNSEYEVDVKCEPIFTYPVSEIFYCTGKNIDITFSTSISFNVGNNFNAELSDATGDFASPVIIGSLNSTIADTIFATIPLNTASGTGYRIRVVADNPATIGTDNGTDIEIVSSVYLGDISFNSQAQVDAFSSCYTYIDGKVTIGGTDIKNLSNFNNLDSISGYLQVLNCDSLITLDGFDNLTYVGGLKLESNDTLSDISGLGKLALIDGSFRISFNPKLISFSGLDSLKEINGYLDIYYNSELTSLSGLDSLTTLGNSLLVWYNNALPNLNGLSNLNSIAGGLLISDNDAMTNLSGLSSLTQIGKYFQVTYCDALINLSGLDNLTTVNGEVLISTNPALTSLTGLSNLLSINGYLAIYQNYLLTDIQDIENIDPVGINSNNSSRKDIEIFNNYILSQCEVTSICGALASCGGVSTRIFNNDSGCNSEAEIRNACPSFTPADIVIEAAEYYIDIDPGYGFGTAISVTANDTIDEDFVIPLTGLEKGFHWLGIRVQTCAGLWNVAGTHLFYVNPFSWNIADLDEFDNPLVEAEYFFDSQDPGEGNGDILSVPIGSSFDIFRSIDTDLLSVGDHKVSIRVMQLDGQWSSIFTIDFTINNPITCTIPDISFTNNTGNAGQQIDFTNTSNGVSGTATFQWDINADGTSEYTTENASHTFATAGSYDVKYTIFNDLDSCEVSLTNQIIIGPEYDKTIAINGSLSFCEGDSVQLTAPVGSNYLWSNGLTNQIITVKNQGDFRVSYTDQNGNLVTSNTINTTVYPNLDIQIYSNPEVNNNSNGSAALEVSGGTSLSYEYIWSTNDTTFAINGLSAGTYTVTVSDMHCPVDISIPILNETDAGVGIVDAEYFFDEDPGLGNGISFKMSWGDTAEVYSNFDLTGLNGGMHDMSFRVKNGNKLWGITRNKKIFIKEQSIPIDTPFVAGDINKLQYYFDEGHGVDTGRFIIINPIQDIINNNYTLDFSGLKSGIHKLFVRARNESGGWGIEFKTNILVDVNLPLPDSIDFPIVETEFFLDNDPGEGNGEIVLLSPKDTIDINKILDVGTYSAGLHNLGIRIKTLNNQWSISKFIEINLTQPSCTIPQADYNYVAGNAGQITTFTNTSLDTLPSGTQYEWDVFADGTIDFTTTDMEYTFTQNGTFPVKLKVINADSCFTSTIKEIAIGSSYPNDISVNGSLVFCSGDSVVLTAPTGTEYLWNTGVNTASITVKETGAYQVTYKDPNAKFSVSNEVYVTVHSSLVNEISVSPENTGLSNGSAAIVTTGGSVFSYGYNWSSGQQLPVVVDMVNGTYQVTVSDTHCPDTLIVTIPEISGITNKIIAAEYFIGDDPGIGNGTSISISKDSLINSFFEFDVSSLPGGVHYLHFRTQSNNKLWSQTKSLIYNNQTIPVFEQKKPIVGAQYYWNEETGVDNSQPISGIVSGHTIDHHDFIPTTGLIPGVHNLFIRVKDDDGLWSFDKKAIIVIEMSIPEYNLTQFPIVKAEVFYTDDPGVGNAMLVDVNPDFTINLSRTFDVDTLSAGTHSGYLRVMTLNGLWSDIIKFDFNLTDPPLCITPEADFSVNEVNINETASFIDMSTNVDTNTIYEWDMNMDDVVDATEQNPSYVFTQAGYYDVKLTVSNGDNCFESLIKTIFVGSNQVDTISYTGITEFCSPDSIVLTAPIGTDYLWNTGDTLQNIIVKSSGTYKVSYKDNDNVQRISPDLIVKVHPNMMLSIKNSPANVGMSNGSANVIFNNGNSYFYNFNWSNGDTTQIISALSAGTYQVSITNGFCYDTLYTEILNITNKPQYITEVEYFIGSDDPGPGLATSVIVTQDSSINSFFEIDTTSLDIGYHRLSYRVKQNDNLWGTTKILPISISDTIEKLTIPLPTIISVEYFFDTPAPGENNGTTRDGFTPTDTLNEDLSITVASLSSGEHDIYLRVLDNLGEYSIIKKGTFVICNPPASPTVNSDVNACQGNNVNLTANSSQSDITYHWEGPQNYNVDIQNPVLSNVNSNFSGEYRAYTVLDANCYSDPSPVLVNIKDLPGDAEDIVHTFLNCNEETIFFVPLIDNATN